MEYAFPVAVLIMAVACCGRLVRQVFFTDEVIGVPDVLVGGAGAFIIYQVLLLEAKILGFN